MPRGRKTEASAPARRSPSTRDAVVLYDAIRYTDAKGTVHEALKGQEVSLPASEFDRLAGFKGRDGGDEPAVAAPRSKDAKEAVAEAEDEAAGT
jgi:hypothetical protein